MLGVLAAETKRTSYPLVNTCDEQDGREARRYRRALRRALAEDRLPSAAETVELLNTREVCPFGFASAYLVLALLLPAPEAVREAELGIASWNKASLYPTLTSQ